MSDLRLFPPVSIAVAREAGFGKRAFAYIEEKGLNRLVDEKGADAYSEIAEVESALALQVAYRKEGSGYLLLCVSNRKEEGMAFHLLSVEPKGGRFILKKDCKLAFKDDDGKLIGKGWKSIKKEARK